MAIEETPRSLRIYFGIVSAFYLLSGFSLLSRAVGAPIAETFALIQIGFGVAFAYMVIRFAYLLYKKPGVMKATIITNVIFAVALDAYSMFFNSAALGVVIRLALTVVIGVYLLRSVKTLSGGNPADS